MLNTISWTSALKGDYNERTMPTPRNLSQDLNAASPWLKALDVSMSDKYFAVRIGGDTPSRGTSQVFCVAGQVPPQLTLQSPGGDVLMRTAGGSSPLISPPRQRMRFN